MTREEAVARIKDHIEIHHIKEDRAIKIIQAFNMAIEALERTEWHYPSRGELPGKGNEVWDGYDIIYYLPDLKKWYRFDDDEPIEAPYVWCYLPDPPKEEG